MSLAHNPRRVSEGEPQFPTHPGPGHRLAAIGGAWKRTSYFAPMRDSRTTAQSALRKPETAQGCCQLGGGTRSINPQTGKGWNEAKWAAYYVVRSTQQWKFGGCGVLSQSVEGARYAGRQIGTTCMPFFLQVRATMHLEFRCKLSVACRAGVLGAVWFRRMSSLQKRLIWTPESRRGYA